MQIKKPAKRLLKQLLYGSGALSSIRALRWRQFAGCRVINFHRVLPDGTAPDYYARLMGEPTLGELEAILKYLSRQFRFMTPRELLDATTGNRRLDPNSIMLTFDDGYVDLFERLLPLLNRLQLPATVFINSGAMHGKALWFQRLFPAIIHSPLARTPAGFGIEPMPLETTPNRVSAISAFAATHRKEPPDQWVETVTRMCHAFDWNEDLVDQRMMNWEQLAALRESPWVTIGGHTVSHAYLPMCDDQRLNQELVNCARELRSRLNLDFLPFSYPNGGSSARVIQAVKDSGYECAFLMSPGLNTRDTDRFQLFREYVTPNAPGMAYDLAFR
ncbi:MAG: polysaccharide deacetylase family protein [Planctomycetales bacterium]